MLVQANASVLAESGASCAVLETNVPVYTVDSFPDRSAADSHPASELAGGGSLFRSFRVAVFILHIWLVIIVGTRVLQWFSMTGGPCCPLWDKHRSPYIMRWNRGGFVQYLARQPKLVLSKKLVTPVTFAMYGMLCIGGLAFSARMDGGTFVMTVMKLIVLFVVIKKYILFYFKGAVDVNAMDFVEHQFPLWRSFACGWKIGLLGE